MRCPTCNSPLGTTQAMFRNPRFYMCQDKNCLTKMGAMYYSYVEITDNWWFSSRYAIQFIHSTGARYAIEGPVAEVDADGLATGNKLSVLFKLKEVSTRYGMVLRTTYA